MDGRTFRIPLLVGAVIATLVVPVWTSAQTAPQAPVRVGGSIKAPTKIKDVKPVYPEDAKAAGVQGMVILEAAIAKDGTVREAKVLRSVHQLLDRAALDAVMQWEYTPTLLNGVPVEVIMTVTVKFTLNEPRADRPPVSQSATQPQAGRGPLRIGGSVKEPTKINDVRPVYPEDAKSAGTQGIVILECVIATNGSVRQAKVLRSAHPSLDRAAVDAVMQWQYTPTLLNGAPVEVVMTVTVNFSLK